MTTLAELSKAVRPYDPEDKRQRNSGFLPGVVAGGAVGTGTIAGTNLQRGIADIRKPTASGGINYVRLQGKRADSKKRFRVMGPNGIEVKATTKRFKRAGGYGAASVGLAGLAALGYKRAASDQNRRWE